MATDAQLSQYIFHLSYSVSFHKRLVIAKACFVLKSPDHKSTEKKYIVFFLMKLCWYRTGESGVNNLNTRKYGLWMCLSTQNKK